MAPARLLTLAFIVLAAALAASGIAGRASSAGTPVIRLEPSAPDANRAFAVTKAPKDGALRVGDRVEIDDPRVLAVLQMHALRAGSVMHADRVAPLPREIVSIPVERAERSPLAVVFAIVFGMFLAMALLVGLRGSASGSLSLAWSFALIALLMNPTTPAWPPGAVLAYAIGSGVLMIAVFLFAIDFITRFTGDGNAPFNRRTRAYANSLGAAAVVVYLAISTSNYVAATTPVALEDLEIAAVAAPAVGFVAALVLACARVSVTERQRSLWVAGSFGIGVVGLFVSIGEQIAGVGEPARDYPLLLLAAMPLGCAYAILRYRLLDIGFVLNRAAVFGVTSVVVLGALAAIDFGLEKILGSWLLQTGVYVQLALALAIGLGTRPIHARVDSVVDDLFFRERHAADRALRRFGRDVGFIDDPDTVLRETVATIAREAKVRCVAFMSCERDFYRAAGSEPRGSLQRIERNDRLILRLLATREPVDLRDVESSATGEFAFPMFARNRLLGILVCGESDDDSAAYAPDGIDAIFTVARAVGLALDLLRVEALEREIDGLRRAAVVPLAID